MAIQLSTTVRNALLDVIESTIGASPTLELRTGAQPANCAAADSGTLVASLALPADWMAAAAAGAKAIAGSPWQDLSADNPGTVAHYRIKAGATCHLQGSVTITGGGGDITLDNNVVAAGQQINITAFNLAAGNA